MKDLGDVRKKKHGSGKRSKFFNYHTQEKRIKVYENFNGKFGFIITISTYLVWWGVIKNSIVLHRKVQLPFAEGISRKSGTAKIMQYPGDVCFVLFPMCEVPKRTAPRKQ